MTKSLNRLKTLGDSSKDFYVDVPRVGFSRTEVKRPHVGSVVLKILKGFPTIIKNFKLFVMGSFTINHSSIELSVKGLTTNQDKYWS